MKHWPGQIVALTDSPLRSKIIAELSCWHAKNWEGNKQLALCKQAGLKAFLLPWDQFQSMAGHSGSTNWMSAVWMGDVIEWSGVKWFLASYLRNNGLEQDLPLKADPNYTPWKRLVAPLSVQTVPYEQFKRTRQEAQLETGSAAGSGSIQTRPPVAKVRPIGSASLAQANIGSLQQPTFPPSLPTLTA